MKENFYANPPGKTGKNRCWRFITKPLSLLAMAVMLLWTTGANAQFSGYYDPGNWVLTQVPAGTGGSVNTGGAPASIQIISGNSGIAGSTIYTITIPSAGDVSFNWSYTTTDGSSWDYPQYSIDGGAAVLMPGYSTAGGISQSGTASIAVAGGQTFSLIMYTADGTSGAATTTFSNFIAPAAFECTGVSSLGNTLSTASSACLGVNFTLSLQNLPSGTGISYQWQTSPDGTTWINAGPSSPQWTTSQSESTYYRCTATCVAADESQTSTPVFVEAQPCINQPAGTTTSSTTTCSATYYDTGGPSGQYNDGQNSVFTIYPEPGNLIQVTFTYFDMETSYDYLIIYDGDNTSAPTINSSFTNPGYGTAPAGAWTGTASAAGQTFTGTYGPLTFRFFSDGSVPYNGWEATVSCITAPDCMPPTGIVAQVTSPDSGTITWNAADPAPLSYDLYYNTTGVAPDGSTTPSFAGITGLSQDLSSLAPNMTYYFWVRSNCSDNSIWAGPVSFYLGYCQVTSTNTFYGIGNFATTGGFSNINNSSGAGGYSDYTAQSVSHIETGEINFTITSVSGTEGMGLWIDWNNDFDFEDAGEDVWMSSGYVTVGAGSFTVPAGTAPGNYRMRAVANILTAIPTPCGVLGYQGFGEAEDYTLTVVDPPSCMPPSGLTASADSPSSGVFSWTAPSPAPVSYDVYYNTTGVAPGDATAPSFAGVTGTSQSVGSLAPFSTYYFWVRSNCASESSMWVGYASFYLGYCVPTVQFSGDYIPSFSTSNAVTNVSTSSSTITAYTDYTSQVIEHYAGGQFDYTVGYVGGTFGFNAWVDWNNDFQFDAATENVTNLMSVTSPASGVMTIPAGTPLGDYTLRIRAQWGSAANPGPCGQVNYGETEDYTFRVVEPPTCVSPIGLTATAVEDGSSTLNWNPSVSNPAGGYEWIIVLVGAGPTGTPIASGSTAAGVTTAVATGLESFGLYALYVRSICEDDDLSSWAGPYNIPGPCTNGVQYPSGVYVPVCDGSTVNTISTCSFAGEYAVIQVVEGTPYTFSVNMATDILTLTNADASQVLGVATGGSLFWVATYSGNVRFYTHISDCGTQSACRTVTVSCGDLPIVKILYTLGGLPTTFGDNHVIQAIITNPTSETWITDVTLSITGANTFTTVYEDLTLGAYQSQLISFAPYTPVNTGMQTVTVSVEEEIENPTATYSVQQLVTPALFSHKEPNAPMAANGVGIGGGYTGNFVAKFTTAVPAEVSEIKVDFAGNGGASYQYRVFAADGPGGLPGTILYDSDVMISVPGQAFLPVSPAAAVTGDFYVGLRELGVNFAFNYQVENPLRSGVFYFNTEDGTYPWTDISVSGAPTARLAIEAQMYAEIPPNCPLSMMPANGSLVCSMAGPTLTWASGGGAPTGYHVYFGTDANPEFVADVTTPQYTIESVEENTTYYWYVVPFNEFGDAAACEIYSFTASMDGCFCTPTYVNGTQFGDLIANVEIIGTTLANNTGTVAGGPSYTYFTGEPNYTAELQAGAAYDIAVSVGNIGGQNVAVWIDYNDNGSFEPSEKVGYTGPSINAFGTGIFTISLNCLAPVGVHRMRVRCVYATPGVDIDPCLEYFYGETEDYDITITPPEACPAPNGGFAEYVTDVSAVLFWNAGCEEEQWNVHLTTFGGGAPAGDPSHPNATSPLTVDGLTPFSVYEFWVMAICDDENSSGWSGPYLFATLAIPPPVNDNPCGATPLTVSEDCNYLLSTNMDATNTPFIPNPTCSFYSGGDVWFSVVVPGNGMVTIDTQDNGIEDAGMAVYVANPDDECLGTFTQIACNDDDSPSGGFWMPYIALTNQTPGQTLYIRVFSYGNFSIGDFGICATSPCTAPLLSAVVTEVEYNTVTISWPSMGPNATYNWEIRESGAAGSGDVGLVESGTTEAGETTITITGLEYLSVYNFYISTNCDEETTSPWSNAVEFVTTILPGCTDETACNYNPDAGVDDGSCVAEETTWYMDADGDGYGDPAVSQVACLGPDGYVSDGTDCDDNNAEKWQAVALYIDNDGDGYDNGTAVICYGNDAPTGYSETTNGNDCDDDNPNSWGIEQLEVALNLIVTEVCNTSTAFALTGGSPAGGTWSGTGVTGGQFDPATATIGNNTITYTVAGDGICTIGGTATGVISVIVCPGIDEVDADDITLYPSYTMGDVTVVGKNLKEAVIMDLNGKQINTVSLNNTSVISMHEYSAGIYFVRVIGDNKVRTFKVVRVN